MDGDFLVYLIAHLGHLFNDKGWLAEFVLSAYSKGLALQGFEDWCPAIDFSFQYIIMTRRMTMESKWGRAPFSTWILFLF